MIVLKEDGLKVRKLPIRVYSGLPYISNLKVGSKFVQPSLSDKKDICCYGFNFWNNGSSSPQYPFDGSLSGRFPAVVGNGWNISNLRYSSHMKGRRSSQDITPIHWVFPNDPSTDKIKGSNYDYYDADVKIISVGVGTAGDDYDGVAFNAVAMDYSLSLASSPPVINAYAMVRTSSNVTIESFGFLRSFSDPSRTITDSVWLQKDSTIITPTGFSMFTNTSDSKYRGWNTSSTLAPRLVRSKNGYKYWACGTYNVTESTTIKTKANTIVSRPIVGFTVSNSSDWELVIYQYGLEIQSQTGA